MVVDQEIPRRLVGQCGISPLRRVVVQLTTLASSFFVLMLMLIAGRSCDDMVTGVRAG